ncbi:MAG: hypothetical protein KTR32_10110 [Granulosicoccus sp.]|nr:hypothetical protein [Granulosicoccus sp.]
MAIHAQDKLSTGAVARTGVDVESYLQEVEANIKAYETELQDTQEGSGTEHWRDTNPNQFTAAQREHTTVLHAGLTMAHDLFVQSAFRGMGYKVEAMEVPDNRALQFGREFGNRGQCNPTYFTVGNLVKKLKQLEASGISKEDIISNYLFATAGSCGPCRFGTYVTEYRKALRDAGFEGFRVILFQQAGGIKQATGAEAGLKIDSSFFLSMAKALLLGDVLNAMMYRMRPYEIEPGATDNAIKRAKQRLAVAFEQNKGMLKALLQSRRELASVKLDRSQIKPRVAIIGEFWAMTTEGEGNYRMQEFLEKEGAEVDIQVVTNWILFLLWAARFDTRERMHLKGTDPGQTSVDGSRNGAGSKFSLEGVNVRKRLLMIHLGDRFIRALFHTYARILGLKRFHLPNMDEIAEVSHAFYDNNLRGGEGHMEVGKLIHNVVKQKVNMTLSIKPFGCMPSSAVSDGVQSLITELYPSAVFLPIETSGDGAVNVYSRVQMQLFKARKAAEQEVKSRLDDHGWSMQQFEQLAKSHSKLSSAAYASRHSGGCTAIDTLQDLINRQDKSLTRWIKSGLQRVKALNSNTAELSQIARRVASRTTRQSSTSALAANYTIKAQPIHFKSFK